MRVNDQLWRTVDGYVADRLLTPDPVLADALRTSDEAGLPAINVAPNQGKLLHLLARIQQARFVLEIGTLGGYSTIWLARGLPADGRLISLEADAAHAEVAKANVDRAGLAEVVDIRVGPALDTLPQLAAEGVGPFDLVFIDADKENNPSYFRWALRLARTGGVIIVDNVVRAGRIIDGDSDDGRITGTRELFDLVASEPRVSATAVQTVGSKGHDGFLIALVTAENADNVDSASASPDAQT
jgi:predicted O-methyltransferase YrrM